MSDWQDGPVRVLIGDVRERLAELPAESGAEGALPLFDDPPPEPKPTLHQTDLEEFLAS